MSLTTPLHQVHTDLGARFTDFAGWSMPLRYGSEIAEHHHVRSHAGLFDLSHMGQIEVTGAEAGLALNHALVSRISNLEIGDARYTLLCHDNGGILDDLIVYRLAAQRFLVVANASNTPIVLSAFGDRFDGYQAKCHHARGRALIAVQGPHAARILTMAASLRYYSAAEITLAGCTVVIARTGYTGEDGFEIFCDADDAVHLWTFLRARDTGLRPAGLAARDTLRLEAGMALHGKEIHVRVTPFEAGLGRLVDFTKSAGFPGRRALGKRAAEGPQSTLVGLTAPGGPCARAGNAIVDLATGERLGVVTSGAHSPTLGHPIALGYLSPPGIEPGQQVGVMLRTTAEPFTVTTPRFYRRKDG